MVLTRKLLGGPGRAGQDAFFSAESRHLMHDPAAEDSQCDSRGPEGIGCQGCAVFVDQHHAPGKAWTDPACETFVTCGQGPVGRTDVQRVHAAQPYIAAAIRSCQGQRGLQPAINRHVRYGPVAGTGNPGPAIRQYLPDRRRTTTSCRSRWKAWVRGEITPRACAAAKRAG